MKKFSRTKLYNELLTNTLKDLSEKYHVNYVKFSAFCHQNNIPIPGSKYRMYLKMNRDVTGLVEPLPTAKNDIIYFETEDDKDTDIASELKDLNDSQKIKQIEQVLANFKYSSKKPLSNEADPKQRFHSTLRVKINADEMDTHGLSRQDRERINEWGHELDITAEIKTAWNNLKDFAKKVFKNYLDTYVDENLRKVVISDKKLWQDRLIPLKAIGITYQPKNSIPRDTVFMDYDALAYCINCILDE